jgi:hypothetical protein
MPERRPRFSIPAAHTDGVERSDDHAEREPDARLRVHEAGPATDVEEHPEQAGRHERSRPVERGR